jgi:phosphoribosylformimino-5-aminoimidazole carboxamide ribotide isomerase
MRVIPVLDLKGGRVVRGVAGRREDYRPVAGRLTASSLPVDVARAFAEHYGLAELYLADLDALAGARPAWEVYAALRAGGFRLWVDAGVRCPADARAVAGAGVERVVVGLETAGPDALAGAVRDLGGRVVFSLDLRGGAPMGCDWGGGDAWSVAARAVALGVRGVLVLDVARVGVGAGTGTEGLCARLASTYPEVDVAAGGGVRGLADLLRLRAAGVSAALVASALHEGRLGREDLAGL